ncbi:Nudix hydrolase domain-containing protein [Psidium guajava]|nr:Nudix hydrolase domain-containing protein [Psidium guajava]
MASLCRCSLLLSHPILHHRPSKSRGLYPASVSLHLLHKPLDLGTRIRCRDSGSPPSSSSSSSSMEAPPEGYRWNGICLVNSSKKIFAASRLDIRDAWQMPQGGIDDGEDPKLAAMRELREETGVSSAEILAEVPYWLTYDFPPDVREKLKIQWGSDWKGQAQKWFLMKFMGKDEEINLLGDGTEKPEFGEWSWMSPDQIIELVGYPDSSYAILLVFGPQSPLAMFYDSISRAGSGFQETCLQGSFERVRTASSMMCRLPDIPVTRKKLNNNHLRLDEYTILSHRVFTYLHTSFISLFCTDRTPLWKSVVRMRQDTAIYLSYSRWNFAIVWSSASRLALIS